MIIRGGENVSSFQISAFDQSGRSNLSTFPNLFSPRLSQIYTAEVENAALAHEAIMDAAALPLPHRILGRFRGLVGAEILDRWTLRLTRTYI